MKSKSNATRTFENFAQRTTKAAGSTAAFLIAVGLVLVWLITGPVFDYSETWQLVINTGTTIVTFLMVFLIQKSQNKDSLAIQLKLNELVASGRHSSNRLVDLESLTEEEMEAVKKYYVRLSKLAAAERDIRESHSIDEANNRHNEKSQEGKRDPAKKKAKPKSRNTTAAAASKPGK